MTEQPRLRGTAETEAAGQLLAEAVEGLDRPWPSAAQETTLRQLQARVQARPAGRAPALWISLATSVAILAVAMGVNLHRQRLPLAPATRVIALGQEATLTLSPGAALDVPGTAVVSPAGRRLQLHSGTVCAEVAHRDLPREGPLVVEAPALEVVVIGTKFCVSTDQGLSTVSVTQGRIRASGGHGASAEVSAGESLRSDDPRLALVAPTLIPPQTVPRLAIPAPPECAASQPLPARRACYERLTKGQGLAAQNALYGLALLERDEAHDGAAALASWQSYAKRFPGGVFAPEASLGMLGELLTEKRYAEALTAADTYLAVSEEAARPPVELLRAQLLASALGQPAEALPALRTLSENPRPELRQEALFSLGQCLLALGQRAEAGRAFHRYLTEFPQGAHVADARRAFP